ncbi:formyl transferase [Colletotrichum paranaense]|uniref:methionyl-tRNA formyltransferase n=1 Tax=Colletotrichum paranaense TaxID=1914294 RepID=A0ABQ9SUJ8_9PEZI|nr:formyl transferase [Colletotrichum paranaense]KAK1543194.1 formyl transferase [Colletotrichum paranaense]
MTWLALRSAAFARVPAATTCRSGARFYSGAATGAGRVSDPLRILFCGSDNFSCAALTALTAERKRNPELIESLEVVVRPSKPSGRGMKNVREVPLKTLAQQLSLPIHVRDTFTKWQPPSDFNLIIAVSFGLFVPPRLLKMAKYGGLNVHPSLLPDFRGPAPLQHTLLQGRTHTGITLQTLDHKDFDHGDILAQTPLPGIPIPENCSTQQLLDIVTPPAAEMLVDGLHRGLHVPPHVNVGWKQSTWGFMEDSFGAPPHAPKITNHDRWIAWSKWTADEIATRQRVLGGVWSSAISQTTGTEKRIKLGRVDSVPLEDMPEHIKQFNRQLRGYRKDRIIADDASPEDDKKVKFVNWIQGTQDGCWKVLQRAIFEHEDGKSILIPLVEGDKVLKVSTMIVEGSAERTAVSAIKSFAVVGDDYNNGFTGRCSEFTLVPF